jgi:hypothetical protein
MGTITRFTAKHLLILMLLFSGIASAQIVNIPDANFKARLIVMGIDTNLDGEIQQSEAAAVGDSFGGADYTMTLQNINISDLTGIEAFVNLRKLFCDNNNLTSLNITSLTHLKWLNCEHNLLTSLDMSSFHELETLTCRDNPLTSLNLTGLYSLTSISCAGTNLTDIDLSSTSVANASIAYSPNLVSLNLKNGVNATSLIYLGAGLQYICADEGEIAALQAIIPANAPNAVISSYCTFTPGGNYNTIRGNISYDFDNNGCDAGDVIATYQKVKLEHGTQSGIQFINTSGNYAFYVQDGDYTVTPLPENASFFNVAPVSAAVNFPSVNNSVTTQDFCVTPNGTHPDLEVILVPLNTARPGFDAHYKIVFRNKGNMILSGSISFNFDDARMDYVSALPVVDSQSLNALVWDFNSLSPFETRSINLKIHLNSPTMVPPLNSGDILDFSAAISPISGDETPDDNASNIHQNVVNSYDPNDKTCLEGPAVTPDNIGKYLHYNINFENLGTTTATNIVVKDVIDTTKFDIDSFQLLYASHPVETKITGNVVEFIFENIDLSPSSANPIGGHGNVLFKIKTIENLTVGAEVTNTANIHFDYNAPVETNIARTTFTLLADKNFTKDSSICVYPNPAKTNVSISAKSNIQSVQLFDIQGRILQTSIENKTTVAFDISNQQSGIYFLKVITAAGSNTEKIIKQ